MRLNGGLTGADQHILSLQMFNDRCIGCPRLVFRGPVAIQHPKTMMTYFNKHKSILQHFKLSKQTICRAIHINPVPDISHSNGALVLLEFLDLFFDFLGFAHVLCQTPSKMRNQIPPKKMALEKN